MVSIGKWLGLKWPFEEALRGIGGKYELNRVIGGFGALAYCTAVNGFVAHEVIWQGKDFDLSTYCTMFPLGLSAIIAAAAGSVALKDVQVAKAKVIESTGAVPAKPPAGPDVPASTNLNTPEGG